jgi:hypothetical protein
VLGALERVDPVARGGRTPLPQRDRERQLLQRNALPLLVERPELGAPALGPHPPHLLEADAQQHAGGVVEEDDDPLLVHEEAGGGEGVDEAPGEDQLDRSLVFRHGRTITALRVHPNGRGPM